MSRVLVPDAARTMGWFWASTRGSGKSSALGKIIVPADLARGIPILFVDPGGRGIDNVLDEFCRMTRSEQERLKLRERVIYVDLAGSMGYVCSFPFLYRIGNESLMTIASRPIETLIKTDPDLAKAPILGANAVRKVGTDAGMVLFACGSQLTELNDLLVRPEAWSERIRVGLAAFPEQLTAAARYFLEEYPKLAPRERQAQTGTLRTKLGFLADPAWKALFGASLPGLDLDDIVANRKCVLLDFRHVPSSLRKLAICWVHSWLVEWIRFRGPSKETTQLSVIVDEATELTGEPYERDDPLAKDLAELIQRLSRNAGIRLFYAVQEIHQLSPQAKQLFLDLGIQTYGASADVETAMEVAHRFFRWTGQEVRKVEEQWHAPSMFASEWTDYRTHEYTRDDLSYLNAQKFLDLPPFTFYLGVARREGELPSTLRRVSIRHVVEGRWVQEELVAKARERLMSRFPRTTDVLASIADRQNGKAVIPSALTPRVLSGDVIHRGEVTRNAQDQQGIPLSPDVLGGDSRSNQPPAAFPTALPLRRKARAEAPPSQPAPAGVEGQT